MLTCIQDQTPNPNVQLCTSTTALQGFFTNSTIKYLDITLLNNNIAMGVNANNNILGGVNNIALGASALELNITSNNNTAIGYRTLQNNIGSGSNTAIGSNAMRLMVSGNNNVAMGVDSLSNSIFGDGNVALGDSSMSLSISGDNNTAIGIFALNSASAFSNMVSVGAFSLNANAASTKCTAIGYRALTLNTLGVNNTAIGYNSASSVITGDNNVAMGFESLANSTGSDNTAIGANSLVATVSGDSNTAVGFNALTNNIAGSGNIALGDSAGSAILLDDNIIIANVGLATDTGIIRIGAAVTHTDTFIPTNLQIGVPGAGYLALLNEYVDTSGPYGDAAVIPDPILVFGSAAIAVWLIPLSTAILITGLTVTMPAPVSPGQIMHISFIGVAGPPVVGGTGIVYTPMVDAAHTVDASASTFSSSWYVSPSSGFWTRI
jgi:hypothetical protein